MTQQGDKGILARLLGFIENLERVWAAIVLVFGFTALMITTASAAIPSDHLPTAYPAYENPQLASTPSATATPTNCANYVYVTATASATIVPGTTDIGNHCTGCLTYITLPFVFRLYGEEYPEANVSSNGNIQFGSGVSVSGGCLPRPSASYTIFAYLNNIGLDTREGHSYYCTPCGIYTSVSGTAPDRIFNIEWKASVNGSYFNYVNFEIRLYESEERFDLIYGDIIYPQSMVAIGVQRDQTLFTEFWCNAAVLDPHPGEMIVFTLPGCPVITPTGTPPTPTSTRTRTPTRTVAPTATATATCTSNWAQIPSPSLGRLNDMVALSRDDIWATGGQPSGSLTVHWDGSQWSLVPSPNAGPLTNDLRAVSALSPDNVWAAGYYYTGAYGKFQTLVEHWDGTQWTIVPSPNIGESDNRLTTMAAAAPDDIWAMGDYVTNGPGSGILIEHWDGTSWTATQGPGNGPYAHYFSKMAALAANDIWVVGTTYTCDSSICAITDAFHYDGTQWNSVPMPNVPGQPCWLLGMTALSPTDIWAVGTYLTQEWSATLTMHYDGSQWTIVPSPSYGPQWNSLLGVSAYSSNDVWAVGYYSDFNVWTAIALHWDGVQWSVSVPEYLNAANELYSAIALSTNDVRAVGRYQDGQGVDHAMVQHYSNPCSTPAPSRTPRPTFTATRTRTATFTPTITGTPTHTPTQTVTYSATVTMQTTRTPGVIPTSTIVPSATPPPIGSPSMTATALPTTTSSTSTQTTVVTTTPTVHVSATTATSTGTPYPPTPCAIQFGDVPEGSTFYPYIRCLACRGILGGYNDGTFRSGNDITRGQLSKIVSNSAGFDDTIPSSQQTFTDVPSDNPFWLWIERIANRLIIGGYDCGGPGEPCDSFRRAYFRWGNNATRGQISKIVSEAYGFDDIVPYTQQTFTDVANTNTFWLWIERLAERGITSGYTCGGSEEACDPQNRPYFRWSNDATRGQTAKVVSNTFFPGCVTPAKP